MFQKEIYDLRVRLNISVDGSMKAEFEEDMAALRDLIVTIIRGNYRQDLQELKTAMIDVSTKYRSGYYEPIQVVRVKEIALLLQGLCEARSLSSKEILDSNPLNLVVLEAIHKNGPVLSSIDIHRATNIPYVALGKIFTTLRRVRFISTKRQGNVRYHNLTEIGIDFCKSMGD